MINPNFKVIVNKEIDQEVPKTIWYCLKVTHNEYWHILKFREKEQLEKIRDTINEYLQETCDVCSNTY